MLGSVVMLGNVTVMGMGKEAVIGRRGMTGMVVVVGGGDMVARDGAGALLL